MDKGLKVLLTAFRKREKPTAEDYELAKAEGYMFDPVDLTHDETLQRIRSVVEKISPQDVADAFLYSLSTRQLQYRSALGSYYYAISIPEHTKESDCFFCSFCNYSSMCNPPDYPINWGGSGFLDWRREYPEALEFTGYNAFNHARYAWGGGCNTRAEYALFDLEQFLLLPKVSPTEADWDILRSILHSINELTPNQKACAFQKLITKKRLLKSNAEELRILLEILGICGVLTSPEAPCYCERFVNLWDREPLKIRSNYDYPVKRWRAQDGVNRERFEKVFGFDFSDL